MVVDSDDGSLLLFPFDFSILQDLPAFATWNLLTSTLSSGLLITKLLELFTGCLHVRTTILNT